MPRPAQRRSIASAARPGSALCLAVLMAAVTLAGTALVPSADAYEPPVSTPKIQDGPRTPPKPDPATDDNADEGDAASPLGRLRAVEEALVELSDRVMQSTVKITAITQVPYPFPELLEPGEDAFVEIPVTYSGAIVTADGYILTVADAFEMAIAFEVTLPDGRTLEAIVPEVNGSACVDKRSNLGLLRIDARKLAPVAFANSKTVRRGQFVIACGNPFGLTGTVSTGMVTGTDRTLWMQSAPFLGIIQTNCDINPGDPGGPAFNSDGEMIGLMWSTFGGDESSGGASSNPFAPPWPFGDRRRDGSRREEGQRDSSQPDQATDSNGDGNADGEGQADGEDGGDGEGEPEQGDEGDPSQQEQDREDAFMRMVNEMFRQQMAQAQQGIYLDARGINFLLPANTLKMVVGELMVHGRVRRVRLGVKVDMSGESLRSDGGVEVREVIPNTPAALAGVEQGDVMLEFDGSKLMAGLDLYRLLSETLPSNTLTHTLKILRDGETITLKITFPESK